MSDDLKRLAVDLDRAAGRAPVDARKAVQVEGYRMKQEWKDTVAGSVRLRGLAGAVTYDTHALVNGAYVEVGYEQRGQGELGNIAEYGTSTSGPVLPAGQKVLRNGADRMEKYLDSTVKPL